MLHKQISVQVSNSAYSVKMNRFRFKMKCQKVSISMSEKCKDVKWKVWVTCRIDARNLNFCWVPILTSIPASFLFQFMQGLAWEGWQRRKTDIKSKVLPNCINVQLLVVCSPRLLVLNSHKYIMGLLGILPISDSPTTRLRHERPWSWSHNTRLVCCSIVFTKPPHNPIFCHC